MKETLIVLDYNRQSVHIYNVDSEAIDEDDEWAVSNLGFDTSNCEWMFGPENMEIIKHEELIDNKYWEKYEADRK